MWSDATSAPVEQCERGVPFGGTAGLGSAAVYYQPIAVLHHGVADIAKPGMLAASLLVEECLGIGRALVGLVGPLLLMEVACRIAARTLRIIVPILAAKALDRCPRLNQRPVHREMIASDQPFHLELGQNRPQELDGDLTTEQPVPVRAEARIVPDRFLDAQGDKPAKQIVKLHPLPQLVTSVVQFSTKVGSPAISVQVIPPHPRLNLNIGKQSSRVLVKSEHQ